MPSQTPMNKARLKYTSCIKGYIVMCMDLIRFQIKPNLLEFNYY